jgi:GNAT superfamily N-acetyltransferase
MPAEISIREDRPHRWDVYASLSIAFTAHTRMRIDRQAARFTLVEVPLPAPFTRDYDKCESPASWARRWDLSSWGMLGAWCDRQRIGSALVAWRTPALAMLEERDDLAVLWDLRIAPDFRGRGVGARLFAAAADWARQRGCTQLKIETQDTNPAACRFYARMGAELHTVRPDAYAHLPGEAQLLWYLDLKAPCENRQHGGA